MFTVLVVSMATLVGLRSGVKVKTLNYGVRVKGLGVGSLGFSFGPWNRKIFTESENENV